MAIALNANQHRLRQHQAFIESAMDVTDVYQQHGASKGYVWDAEDAVTLRRKHRLLGSYLGCVANFKSQNAVSGLPLELGVNEVAFSVEKGWARVLPPVLQSDKAWLVHSQDRQAQAAAQEEPAGHNTLHTHKRRKQSDRPHASWLEDYYQFYSSQGAYPPDNSSQVEGQQHQQHQQPANGQGGSGGGATHTHAVNGKPGSWVFGPYRPNLTNAAWLRQYYEFYYGSEQQVSQSGSQPGQPVQVQGQGQHTPSDPAPAPKQDKAAAGPPPAWKAALQEGAQYVLPLKAEAAVVSADNRAGTPTEQAQQVAVGGGSSSSRQTSEEDALDHIRYTVFKDLHSQGYAMSSGPKFGCDVLAYPGDPSLFHAQFTVRFMQPDQAINPLALKGAARGSHTARKHLLLATLPPGAPREGAKPMYISIAPEAGFGKAAG